MEWSGVGMEGGAVAVQDASAEPKRRCGAVPQKFTQGFAARRCGRWEV